MPNVTHKHKGGYVFFVTVKSDSDHSIYLTAYGRLAAALLEKYAEDQRADNEELFAEWDKSVQEASSQIGFSASHEVEDGYVYVTTFQNGLRIPQEDETESDKRSTRR